MEKNYEDILPRIKKHLNSLEFGGLSQDPDICTWNSKRYPVLKKLESRNEILTEHSRTKRSKDTPKSFISTSPYELAKVNITDMSSGSPKRVLKNFFKKHKPVSLNFSMKKHQKKIENCDSIDFSSVDNRNQTPQNFKYSSYISRRVKDRSRYLKPHDQNDIKAKTKLNFKISPEIADKYPEILNNSPSPSSQKTSPVIHNKLSMYTARTLEELLASTKLPELYYRKTRNYYRN